MAKEAGKSPRCRTPKGCPIEDCATDPRLEWAISQFLKAKQLSQVGSYTTEMVQRMMSDAGFMDDPMVLYEAEFIYQQFLEIEAKKKNG